MYTWQIPKPHNHKWVTKLKGWKCNCSENGWYKLRYALILLAIHFAKFTYSQKMKTVRLYNKIK